MRENGKQGSKHAIASLSWSNLQCLAMSIYSITGPCPIPVLPHGFRLHWFSESNNFICDCESWHSVFPSSVKSFLAGSLTKLQNLQGLFLTDNCLMELPVNIGQLKNLKDGEQLISAARA